MEAGALRRAIAPSKAEEECGRVAQAVWQSLRGIGARPESAREGDARKAEDIVCEMKGWNDHLTELQLRRAQRQRRHL